MKSKAAKATVVLREREGTQPIRQRPRNNVRKIRESLLMSRAELARKAGVSALTIDRIEAGYDCRMETKRKIILALGLQISERTQVFGEPHPVDETDSGLER